MKTPKRDPSEPSASDPAPTEGQPDGENALTEAQRDFARLLGRLLAERWREEQRSQKKSAPTEDNS